MLAEFEIPVFLLDLDDLAPLGTEIPGFIAVAIAEELLLAHRIVARVGVFIELALGLEGGEDALDAGLVAIVDGFRPAVVFDSELLPEVDEFLGGALDEGGGVHAFFFGGLLDFLAVLIDSGEEERLIAAQLAVAGDDVGEHLFVGMPDVWRAVGVIDGGGEIKHGRGAEEIRLGGVVQGGVRAGDCWVRKENHG